MRFGVSRAEELNEDLPPLRVSDEHRAAVRDAIRRRKGTLTLGDALADTGLAREDAELALKVCLADYAGHLDVLDTGDIVYRFDARLAERDRDPLRVRLWRGVKRVATFALKLGIMVTLVGYSIVFALLALALILGLFSRSDRDVDEDSLALAWLPLRALMELFIFFPDFFLWGLPSGYGRTPRTAVGRGARKPLHESIFSYAFGPPRPPQGLAERDRQGAQLIRHFGGVLASPDVIATTGVSKYDAEEWLGRLLGRFGGDVDVTDEGEILYRFGDLARTAAAAPRPPAPPLEQALPITGNKPGTNALIAGLSAFVLAGAVFIEVGMARVGLVLPALSWGLAYIPGFVGVTLLALPLVRGLALRRENGRLQLRNLRRLALATTSLKNGTLDPTALRHVIPDTLRRLLRPAAPDQAIRSLAVEFEGEPGDGGAYVTPAITTALAAAEQARHELRLDRPVDAPVVFSTSDETAVQPAAPPVEPPAPAPQLRSS
ncbi:MAG TPA: hypothetical protein VF832_09155, partial [Longimicrobiales bacterium]